ncbi:hypothetical protein [Xanthomonas populi]|uniref:hypothetical protein n=1 Tax=Xanthomonas populi TaxID=53414 RepID=UPI001ABEFA7E|nr:hypothetical protein [Xanthomonas populi]
MFDPVTGKNVSANALYMREYRRRKVFDPVKGDIVSRNTKYSREKVVDKVKGDTVSRNTLAKRKKVTDPVKGDIVSRGALRMREKVLDEVKGDFVSRSALYKRQNKRQKQVNRPGWGSAEIRENPFLIEIPLNFGFFYTNACQPSTWMCSWPDWKGSDGIFWDSGLQNPRPVRGSAGFVKNFLADSKLAHFWLFFYTNPYRPPISLRMTSSPKGHCPSGLPALAARKLGSRPPLRFACPFRGGLGAATASRVRFAGHLHPVTACGRAVACDAALDPVSAPGSGKSKYNLTAG